MDFRLWKAWVDILITRGVFKIWILGIVMNLNFGFWDFVLEVLVLIKFLGDFNVSILWRSVCA